MTRFTCAIPGIGVAAVAAVAAALDHKLANIFADISDQTLKDIEAFKVITSGDTIDAEKKFRDSYSYKPYAKLIFSANYPPRPRDYFDDCGWMTGAIMWITT